jgi:hypothetical protein
MCKRNKKWYLKKINFFLIQKYQLLVKKKDFLFFDTININLKAILLSDEDILVKNILLFLEIITGQKALPIGIFKYIGSTKKFFFNAIISLRKNKLLQFIIFFSTCCLGLYYKRNGVNSYLKKINIYNLIINDYNIFPNYNFINIIVNLLINFKFLSDKRNIKFEDYLQLLKIK